MSRVIRFHRFGPPEVLKCEELPTPAPAAGEVLVRVQAIGGAGRMCSGVRTWPWSRLRCRPVSASNWPARCWRSAPASATCRWVPAWPVSPAHTPDHYPAYGDVVLMPRAALAVYPEVLTPVEASVYYTGLLVAYFPAWSTWPG